MIKPHKIKQNDADFRTTALKTPQQITQWIQDSVGIAQDGQFYVSAIRPLEADCVLPYHQGQLRAGGTLSGPTMMTLADAAMYAAY
ncbi:MAG: hypothetical protein IPG70_06270 [Moraxellaceae bacterium]|nr:hypothetical protein [Moraxellaceae bacterium]